MPAPIKERERAAILSSLAAGVVPAIGLQHIQVGRKAELTALLDDLQRVEQGGAAIRFIVGRFGSGKSFFLNLVQTVALDRRFVVAHADVTPDRRLHGSNGEARALFGELTKNLATRSKPEGGALTSLVERWVGELAQEVKSNGGDDAAVERRVVDALKPLQDLVSGYDFANVLLAYWRGYVAQDEQLQNAAIRWLRAEYATKTDARRDLAVRTIIDDDGFYNYLKLLAAFVRIAGYRGLLVSIDELVVLSHRLNHRVARDHNYETILSILNDCLQGSVSGLGFLFAATDSCLSDPRRGLFSYEALATRLAPNRFATTGVVDLSGPVITLKNLSPEDCFVLLQNIRRVHARGENETRFLSDNGIEAYLADCQRRMGASWFQTPRDTVKDFVGLLSVIEQNPGTDWRERLGKITTIAPQTNEDEASPDEAAEPGIASDGPRTSAPTSRPVSRDDDLTSFKT